jgi:hypothetical protein
VDQVDWAAAHCCGEYSPQPLIGEPMLDKNLVKVGKVFIWRSPVHSFWYRIAITSIENGCVYTVWEEFLGSWKNDFEGTPKTVHPSIVQTFAEFVKQDHVYPLEKSNKTFEDFL